MASDFGMCWAWNRTREVKVLLPGICETEGWRKDKEVLAGETMKTDLFASAFKATNHFKYRFQNLYRLLDSDLIYQSRSQINKQAASGINGKTILEYHFVC